MILRLKNITDRLKKRHLYFNKPIIINYADGVKNNIIEIKPKEEYYIDVDNIPSDITKYKMLGVLIVEEVDRQYFENVINKPKKQPKKVSEPKKVVTEKKEKEVEKTTK